MDDSEGGEEEGEEEDYDDYEEEEGAGEEAEGGDDKTTEEGRGQAKVELDVDIEEISKSEMNFLKTNKKVTEKRKSVLPPKLV